MLKKLRKIILFISILALIYIAVLIYPDPFFTNQYQYKNFQVYSDNPIPKEIETILDQVDSKLRKSELYQPTETLKIYFCNDDWRFGLFSRSRKAGGVVNGFLSANAFFRSVDIKNNQLIPPNGWMLSTHDRPLSYFIAHELTHSLQSHYDRLMILKVPAYIMEGYADYIAKGDSYDFTTYKRLYLEKDPVMNPKDGLYNKFHLYMAYLLDNKNMSFRDILREKPQLERVLQEILEN